MDTGAIWLASYPKSGNTWLRCLLDAYYSDGKLDINDMRTATSDSGATLLQAVSPVPLANLSLDMQMLLRPAGVLTFLSHHGPRPWVKTHSANIIPDGLCPMIPAELTHKALYVVRDPRSVLLSFAKFYKLDTEAAVEAMEDLGFVVGGYGDFAPVMVSSWSNHVASWTSEKRFPVHCIKYEDLMVDAGKELTEALEFLEIEVDPARVARAVEAAELSRLRKQEEDNGFEEAQEGKEFFTSGGTRWQDELGPKWAKQIEQYHEPVMKAIGYIEEQKCHTIAKAM